MSEAPSAAIPARAFATRAQLLFALFLVATLNGFVGTAVRTLTADGWLAFADLFGISAILWTALAAGLKILADDERRDGWRRGDAAVAALVVAAALLPSPAASSLALTALSAWAIVTGAPGSAVRRAGILFLALAGALFWGRLFLGLFSRPLLDIDAWFVAHVVGAAQRGNLIWSDGFRLIVGAGCSSIHGLSLALLFWATVNQYYRVRFGWTPLFVCLAALAATVAVNVARMAAMLRWPAHFQEIHVGWGYYAANWATLILVAAICLAGARRDVFAAH